MFRWAFLDESGATTPGGADDADDVFGTRDEAEDWLRGRYEDLADAGVAAVALMDCQTKVYTMSLEG